MHTVMAVLGITLSCTCILTVNVTKNEGSWVLFIHSMQTQVLLCHSGHVTAAVLWGVNGILK